MVGDRCRQGRPWRGRLFRRGSPLQTSPCENFPSRRPPVERIANESTLPAGGSRGSPFSEGGKHKNMTISPYKAICSAYTENRTAAMGCPVFDDMGVFISNISALALAFDWPMTTELCPLFTVHCSLLIAHCQLPIRPQKKFPGAGPWAYRICNTVCICGGLCRGRSRRGRLGGTGLSERLHRVGRAGQIRSRFFVRRVCRRRQ